MTTRTLVRVSDRKPCSGQLVPDLVEHALPLYREIADAGSAREPRARHVTFEATEIELQRLDLELLGRRLQIAGADHELGDQAGKRLIAGWQICGRCAEAAA